MDLPARRAFTPQFDTWQERSRAGFDRQRVMRLIGAELVSAAPGEVVIQFPFHDDLTQQDGFIHAGIVTAVVDSACGFAAWTLMPAGAGVLTVEYKVNLLAPARGEHFTAVGRVVKPGRNLTVCAGEVYAVTGTDTRLVATMSATMMTMHVREGTPAD